MAIGRSPQPDGTTTELKELRERFEDYRKERLENEKLTKPYTLMILLLNLYVSLPCRILRVQVEEYREEASKLRLDNATIIFKVTYIHACMLIQ